MTHGEGPLLIVAGAGTGKTTVITRRIAWLIAEKLAKPSEILALTFTDRAAFEMVERVDRLVPYGHNDAQISTFHAFGDRLLREHAFEAGLSDRSTVLSRAEQVIFLREHLFELPLDRYRPLGDPTRFLSGLVTLISRLRDEDVTPDGLPGAAERLAGGRRRPVDAALAERRPRQAELAATYAAYEQLMRGTDRHRLRRPGRPRAPPPAGAPRGPRRRAAATGTSWSTSSRTRTTPSGSWSRCWPPHGNVTVVGDDDQSIYRFRGAASATSSASARPTRPPERRARRQLPQPAADPRRGASAHPAQRPGSASRRARGSTSGCARAAVRATEPPSRRDRAAGLTTGSDEADAIADRIGASIRGGRRAGDHAILVRGNRDADPILRALNMARIPWRFSGTAGLYRQPEVRVLISFLRAVNDPDDSVSLYDLATSEIFGLARADVTLALNAGAAAPDPAWPPRCATRPSTRTSRRSRRALEVVQRLLGQPRGASGDEHGAVVRRAALPLHLVIGLARPAGARGARDRRRAARERRALLRDRPPAGSLLRDDRLPFLVAQLDTLIETGDDPSTPPTRSSTRATPSTS